MTNCLTASCLLPAACLAACLLHATCLLLLLLLSNSSGRLSDFGVAASAMVPRLFGFLNELKSKSTAEAVANTTLQNESTFPCRNCTVTLASNGQQQRATARGNSKGQLATATGTPSADRLSVFMARPKLTTSHRPPARHHHQQQPSSNCCSWSSQAATVAAASSSSIIQHHPTLGSLWHRFANRGSSIIVAVCCGC